MTTYHVSSRPTCAHHFTPIGPCRGNRKFFLRGQSHFSLFFPGVKCFFPVENFHFGRPKTYFSGFQRWKKKSSPHFVTFPPSIFNFPPFFLQFSFFSSQFSPLFPFSPLCPLLLFSPIGQQKFPGHKSLRQRLVTSPPPPPPTCYATA